MSLLSIPDYSKPLTNWQSTASMTVSSKWDLLSLQQCYTSSADTSRRSLVMLGYIFLCLLGHETGNAGNGGFKSCCFLWQQWNDCFLNITWWWKPCLFESPAPAIVSLEIAQRSESWKIFLFIIVQRNISRSFFFMKSHEYIHPEQINEELGSQYQISSNVFFILQT